MSKITIQSVQEASDNLLRAIESFISRKISTEAFLEAVENLYVVVKSIGTGEKVGATADKLFRQANLLNTSSKDLVNAVENGGSIDPFYTRVKNGTNNVQKTASELLAEGGI